MGSPLPLSQPGFPAELKTGSSPLDRKAEVILVLGATGSGKSKLSVDLAAHFPAEIVNSDKIQVHKGLDVLTNKVTAEECKGVPHHLLGVLEPDVDFTVADFCRSVNQALGSITDKGKVPIITGGSNTYIEELVSNDAHFKRRYKPLFLWIDVSLPVLRGFVSDRVDRMVQSGLVDEVRGVFDPDSDDYTRGVRKAIGVPELDRFLKAEKSKEVDAETLARLLEEGIDQIKRNTYQLACRQREKILRLRDTCGWELHQISATKVLQKRGEPEELEIWENEVVRTGVELVNRFLADSYDTQPARPLHTSPSPPIADATPKLADPTMD